ncbi:MAG: hypothetical protein A2365_03355 [Candidatus Nealsonbacteria bacterium RIFOXYB1_FULL_40_15]|uniref:VanZ-like domain-containing protein n=2 Tax=Candidatus Nealsoniibacteriota TaxID=1817911 RepID=A0A1G2ESQ2_9BACT|nr:MAG: hypothetical protein A2365_03355 [Candidatus Nealsonbacteria bacterium RIFOXYB1_FULL_40_15]OGZ28819.1 MAG: hypothetical protein A2427_00150 [Candidatus Nealsonbacteria bacterium RIFOXYC1_FULL_40_7]OGZ29375.1 MAG: hypothetical protein A2562_04685 [Candidatus Nealsonbacteria bacterium RIFOXYD1_FULL_39_11]
MNKDFWLVHIWKNGTCFDLWSVNHFLAGFLLGFSFIFLRLPFWPAFLASLIVMYAWEMYEKIESGTQEKICNKITDIVLGALGFLSSKIVFLGIGDRYSLIVFGVSAIVFAVLEIWGLAGYNERKKKGS